MIRELVLVFVAAVLVNNFVLKYFLGICPFLGVSDNLHSAVSMGFATTFVMSITAPVAWCIKHFVLDKLGLPFLEYVCFIIVIASLVQFVEMVIKKFYPALHQAMGIYLPLITTNCAILFMALQLVLREYSLLRSIVFGFGSGLGFTLAITIMAGIREEIEFCDVPRCLKGPGITLIIAGLLALIFVGLGGLIKVN
ncbi:MAG: RnfABCDGE type electron transport complex subunit A [Candidatus Omnitrophica bacterium]|nr:RnfABCDGE type electron transport complex subunit A [Candidatus Omnitrophota bacterium]